MGDNVIDRERDIVRLIRSTWAALDSKDWTTYSEGFTEDGEFVIAGQSRKGHSEIAAGPARDLDKYDALQHFVMNELVHVDGRQAKGSWYAIAIHVPDRDAPGVHADVGLRYAFHAMCEGGRWRFLRVMVEPVWTAGAHFTIAERSKG